jgi:hypothetical protein
MLLISRAGVCHCLHSTQLVQKIRRMMALAQLADQMNWLMLGTR